MAAAPVQLPLRRESQALLDEDKILRPPALALDELVHYAGRGVHEGRGGSIDEIPRREKVGAPGREAGTVEDPEDRSEDVVALHVRGAVEGIKDDGEPTASHRLHVPHLLGGDL